MNKFVLALFFLVFAFSSAHAQDKLLDIQVVTSPGGIKAWLVEDHSVPVTMINYAFKNAGAVQDPADKQGLAQLLSNTLDEGAGDLDSKAFQKLLSDQSITLAFDTDRDDFSGVLKTLTRYRKDAFDLLKLALTQPRFDEEPVNRMRESNKSRIRSSLSDPDWMAARLMNDRAFEGHAYAKNSGGTLTSLDKITPEDLRNFFKTKLGKNNLVVAVAGDITKEELTVALDEIFGGLPVIEAPPAVPDVQLQNTNKIFVYNTPIPQTIVSILQPGIQRNDPDFQTAQIMNFILGSSGFGSRLMTEIREKRGLTYGIYTSFMNMSHFDGLEVSTSTENKNAAEMVKLTKDEWNKMKDTPVSAKELQDAKNYLIGSLPLSLTSTNQIAGLLLSMQLDDLPIDYLEQRERAIKATTQDKVQAIAKRLLNTDQMVTVLVGKPEGIEGAEILTELPDVK